MCLTELVSPEPCAVDAGAFPAGVKPHQGLGLAGAGYQGQQRPQSKASALDPSHTQSSQQDLMLTPSSPSINFSFLSTCLGPPEPQPCGPPSTSARFLVTPTAASLPSPLPFQATLTMDIASQCLGGELPGSAGLSTWSHVHWPGKAQVIHSLIQLQVGITTRIIASISHYVKVLF